MESRQGDVKPRSRLKERWLYRPKPEDLERVQPYCPDGKAGDPCWVVIESKFIAAGWARVDLAGLTAPDLIGLLGNRKRRSIAASRGGRPRVNASEKRRREELLEAWERAKTAGVRQKDFCQDEGVSTTYLTMCIDWRRQKKRRAGHAP